MVSLIMERLERLKSCCFIRWSILGAYTFELSSHFFFHVGDSHRMCLMNSYLFSGGRYWRYSKLHFLREVQGKTQRLHI
jgi:hypothetical protein